MFPVLTLRSLPIDQLKPAPYNPRRVLKPTDPAWKKLERSIAEFGLVEPLVWNELTGHVVGGHARLAILRKLGIAEVPVSVVELTPEREKALNIILNNREAQARFDPDKLTELLSELEHVPELELTGFDAGDLRDLRLEPVADLEPLDDSTECVEIMLSVSRGQYDQVSARVDELVREFDLDCHVRGL